MTAAVPVATVVALRAGMLLRETPFGECPSAVGGNEEAAQIAAARAALSAPSSAP